MDIPIQPPEEAVPDGPGSLLRRARKAASLEQEDVAKYLKLSVRLVDALERDDYRDMPPATFVRGYLTAYAKRVKMDVDEVLARFDMDTPHVETLSAKGMPPRQTSLGDPSMRGVTYVLAIALVILLLIWWLGESTPPEDAAQSIDEETPAVAPALPRTNAEPDAFATDPAPTALTEATDESPAARQANGGAPPDEPASNPDSNITDPNGPAAPDEAALAAAIELSLRLDGPDSISEEPTVTTSESPPPPSASEEAAESGTDAAGLQAGDAGADRLALTVRGDCWVSVVDSRDRRLLYRLVPEGKTVEVQGDAPFRLTLGNAEAVDVRFNGETFDHRRFHRGNIARFSIPVANP